MSKLLSPLGSACERTTARFDLEFQSSAMNKLDSIPLRSVLARDRCGCWGKMLTISGVRTLQQQHESMRSQHGNNTSRNRVTAITPRDIPPFMRSPPNT